MPGDQYIHVHHAQQLHIAQNNRERWEAECKDALLSARIPESLKTDLQSFADLHNMSLSRAIFVLLGDGLKWHRIKHRSLDELFK